MADPQYSFSTIGGITGIKSLSILVPSHSVVNTAVPTILTELKNCPSFLQKQGSALYGEYVFVGVEPSGRINGDFLTFNFAFVGDMEEVERDPVTQDHWQITKVIATTQDITEASGTVKTSQEIGTGVYVNETRTLAIPGRVQTEEKETEEFGLTTVTSQYVTTDTGTADHALGYRVESLYTPVNAYFGLLRMASFSGPFVKNDIEFDKRSNCQIQVQRELSIIQKTTQAAGTQVTSFQLSEGLFLNTTKTISGLDDYLMYVPSSTNLPIPDELQGVSIEWAEASGEGSFNAEWNGLSAGSSVSLSGSESGNAESSASCIPDITMDAIQYWTRKVPTTLYFFYLQLPVTSAQVLAKVSATAWPIFKPRGHIVSLKGAKVSVNARASASASLSADTSSGNYSKDLTQGEGTGFDVSLTHQTRALPPMIHGIINITGAATKSIEVTSVANVGWVGTGTIPFPSADASASATKAAEGEVSPTLLSATSPSAVPTSGLYLVDCNAQPWEWGYAMIAAEVFDASVLA